MAKMTLTCAVYGDGSVFPVQIARDASVSALQVTIARRYNATVRSGEPVDPASLSLSLARAHKLGDTSTWLCEGMLVDEMLLLGESSTTEFEQMIPTRTLDEDEYFGPNFRRGRKEIHVLVALPKSSNLTQARHKRWASINVLVREKNRDTRHSHKRQKCDDVARVVDCATLSWDETQCIFNFDHSYELPPSDGIPDAAVERLRARIVDLQVLYGPIRDGNDATRSLHIAAVLETVSRLLGDVRILVDEDVTGTNVQLKNRLSFVLERGGSKRVAITQANHEQVLDAVAHNVAGLEALADSEGLRVVYGIVTNFHVWTFLVSDDTTVRKHVYAMDTTDSLPSLKALKAVVGKVHALLCGIV